MFLKWFFIYWTNNKIFNLNIFFIFLIIPLWGTHYEEYWILLIISYILSPLTAFVQDIYQANKHIMCFFYETFWKENLSMFILFHNNHSFKYFRCFWFLEILTMFFGNNNFTKYDLHLTGIMFATLEIIVNYSSFGKMSQ